MEVRTERNSFRNRYALVRMGSASTARTMKAGRWDPGQKKMVINEVSIPGPGPNERVVKIT